MATIFISYRKAGLDRASAGRLYDSLQAKFSVFLDDGELDPGDKWADEILGELTDCRIVIAVIGPEWVKRANLRRMAKEDNWIRKELLAAFAIEGVRIIPVLVEGAELIEADLPAALRPLTSYQTFSIDPKVWKARVDDLCRELTEALAGRSVHARAADAVPLQLPNLCDRVDQEEGLIDAVRAGAERQTLACVLPGQNLDGHQAFIDRLKAMQLLERLFQASKGGVGFYQLEFMRELAKRRDFGSLLRRAIRRRVLQDSAATDAQVDAVLRHPGLPTVMVLEVTWEDCAAFGDDLVPGLIKAWFALFGDPPVVPTRPMLFWINLTFAEGKQESPALASEWALPKLAPIFAGDIKEWMARPEVKRYVLGRESRLLTIHEDRRWLRDDGTLPMLKFSDAVNSILNAA